MEHRIGFGYDVHRLVPDRELILGGVKIEYEFGLLGHSDADCLLHAISDALLGAACLGDIGRHFPDSDPKYKGISSLILLKEVKKKINEAGFKVQNIDATIVAQAPKLAPFILKMEANIASALECNNINIKATTTEGLGFCGEKRGIACYCVALLIKSN